jgi:hypothetical protein
MIIASAELATVALEQEAELAVTKQQLHKALAAQKLTPTSQKVLSRARHATRRDLLNARLSRVCPDIGERPSLKKRVRTGGSGRQGLRSSSRSHRN